MPQEEKSVELFLRTAKKLGIETNQVKGTHIYQLKHGRKKIYLKSRRTSALSAIGNTACDDKTITKNLLMHAGLRTPYWREFYNDSKVRDMKRYLKQLKFPVVVKPYRGSHGDNIAIDIQTVDEAVAMIKNLQPHYFKIFVEEMFIGTEIRVFATRKKFLAAAVRRPSSIEGDGLHTIKQLVDSKNLDPRRVPRASGMPLQYVSVDKQYLKKQGLSLRNVPELGQRVYLQKVSNVACGGDSIDVTECIHPSIKRLAVKAIRAIPDLPYAGIDFMTKDFSVKQTNENYSIVEINANAMLYMHYEPYKGKKRNVTEPILRELFPRLAK